MFGTMIAKTLCFSFFLKVEDCLDVVDKETHRLNSQHSTISYIITFVMVVSEEYGCHHSFEDHKKCDLYGI